MVEKSLPSIGTRVPAEEFHVSQLNVRVEERFGESEEDKALVHQLWLGKKIISPFKARPEGDGYGVFVGRRRFLAKKVLGIKDFVVGADTIIEDIDEEQARLESLLENLKILRKEMNPITRARKLSDIISRSPDGLRGTARRLGIPPSTLSEWLKILELSPKMQEVTRKGLLSYTEALEVARGKLGELRLDNLAETLEAEGIEAYRAAFANGLDKQRQRGIPKGKYAVLRISFDKAHQADMRLMDELKKLIRARRMKSDDYLKWVLTEHVNKFTTQTARAET